MGPRAPAYSCGAVPCQESPAESGGLSHHAGHPDGDWLAGRTKPHAPGHKEKGWRWWQVNEIIEYLGFKDMSFAVRETCVSIFAWVLTVCLWARL